MSRFTVTWLKEVEGDLARIWVGAADRRPVAAAADAIDAELAEDAGRKGASVSEGLRSLYVPPLFVLFVVRDGDRIVEVVSVRSDRPLSERQEKNGAASAAG
jgi:plasmid stabilization system protein ParE